MLEHYEYGLARYSIDGVVWEEKWRQEVQCRSWVMEKVVS